MASRLAIPSSVGTVSAQTVELTFPTPSAGEVWNGSIVLPASVGADAIWTVTAAGIVFGTFTGYGPYGPITLYQNEVLTLSGTSLDAAATEVVANFIGALHQNTEHFTPGIPI